VKKEVDIMVLQESLASIDKTPSSKNMSIPAIPDED
jgi:hypothetical protein